MKKAHTNNLYCKEGIKVGTLGMIPSSLRPFYPFTILPPANSYTKKKNSYHKNQPIISKFKSRMIIEDFSLLFANHNSCHYSFYK